MLLRANGSSPLGPVDRARVAWQGDSKSGSTEAAGRAGRRPPPRSRLTGGQALVSTLIVDEHNLAEMARHGVSAAEVVQVIANRHVTAPNARGEASSILLIGESDGGRLLTIPLAPTDDPTTWRRATAFDASRHQRAVFRRRVRRSRGC